MTITNCPYSDINLIINFIKQFKNIYFFENTKLKYNIVDHFKIED